MRIGIDISQIVYGTGVSHYTQNLIEALLKIDPEDEFVLFGSSLRLRNLLDDYNPKAKNFKKKIYSFPSIFWEWLWNRLHWVDIERLTGKLDLFHTSDWLEPPARCPKVTTVHDLAVFRCPETFSPVRGHDIVTNIKRKLAWVKRESSAIIAVSEATKADIIELLEIPSDKVWVIYEAAPKWIKKVSPEETKKIKEKFKIESDYLLSVSTLEPRKNLRRIIQAYQTLKEEIRGLALVLVGKVGWGGNLPAEEKTIFTGYVTNEEVAALYSGAAVFVYPSLYEGFGQPILEAMTCGCPVVTSKISSMPEVAGEAAILVDPLSVEEIAEGIKIALKRKEELAEKGYRQAKKFSWEKCARETLKVYKGVAAR
jgi:glycosyltransferase involved in cell wall biosynthesis